MKVDIQNMPTESSLKFVEGVRIDPIVMKLIKEIGKHHTVEEISSSQGYILKLHYDNKESVDLEVLFSYLNEEAVVEVSKNLTTDEKRYRAFFTVNEGEDKKIKMLTSEKGNLVNLNELPYKEEFFNFLAKEESTDNNFVTSEAWYDGCLIFGDPSTGYHYYRHCGSQCGDNGPTGGGTPINSLDSCCRAHDRCYSIFGNNDCGCDQELGQCAERTSDPGWYLVGSWAYDKPCN